MPTEITPEGLLDSGPLENIFCGIPQANTSKVARVRAARVSHKSGMVMIETQSGGMYVIRLAWNLGPIQGGGEETAIEGEILNIAQERTPKEQVLSRLRGTKPKPRTSLSKGMTSAEFENAITELISERKIQKTAQGRYLRV